MDSINAIFTWLSEHESGFSALAALVVIFGVVFSPLGSGLRGLLARDGRSKTKKAEPPVDAPLAKAPIVGASVAETAATATQDFLTTPPPLITDKPSIAVLPFVNMSDDTNKEFFADGMTEDIITGLSCDSRLFVIARNSTFAYKGQSPDIRTVGRELGVGYVLEGSIRPISDRLRITVQLIETATGSHIWADKIDRPIAEIFDIQDEVVDSLVSTLCANVNIAEGRRAHRQAPENLKAWELCVRAETLYAGQLTPAAIQEATVLTKAATEIEPGYGFGWVLLGHLTAIKIAYLVSDNIAETAEEALKYVNKAVLLAPGDATVLGYAGFASTFSGKANLGVDYLDRSLNINPNNGLFRMTYANALSWNSRKEEALVQLNLFFRQSPKDPNTGRAYFFRAMALLTLERYAEAESSASLAVKHAPSFAWAPLARAQALAGLGQIDEAKSTMRRSLELAPHFTLAKLIAFIHFIAENPKDAELLSKLTKNAWPE